MKNYFKLLRVHHYIKNLLVFAALIFSGQFLDPGNLMNAGIGFVSFCLISSAVYIINDIRDREKDRNHPKKCLRPIASGAVPVWAGAVLAAVLAAASLAINIWRFDLPALLFVALYLLLNVGYSMGLKNVPLIDVTILVSGFLIRVVYGAVITGIVISDWLYLTVIAVSFFFSLGKRRGELQKVGNGSSRKVLEAYNVSFLDKNMYICLALANVFYALWSMDPDTIAAYDGKRVVLTAPIVLLITMKYSLNIEGDSDGDPVEVLLKDKVLLLLCVVYAAVMMYMLYL